MSYYCICCRHPVNISDYLTVKEEFNKLNFITSLFQSCLIFFVPLFSSDEMKDQYLTMRFCDAELATNIVTQFKRLPSLVRLARQPFICWMVATVFERCYRYLGYGVHPPRLTPFYINIMVVQTNRRLQFYDGKSENELVTYFLLCKLCHSHRHSLLFLLVWK